MFKKFLRHFIVNVFALYAASVIADGIIFEYGLQTIFLSGLGLTLVSMFVKPIINMLLLPINLITFNLFRWVTSAIALYLVTLVVPGFGIERFYLTGFSSRWFDLPTLDLGGILAYVAFSFIISLFASILYWLIN